MIGMNRANSENSITNHAKAPTVIPISVNEGCQKRRCWVRSCLPVSRPMITKRSNHIPMLTKNRDDEQRNRAGANARREQSQRD